MRYMTAEDRLDAEDARLRDAVVEAALAWRKAHITYSDQCLNEIEHLEDALYVACDALLSFLGQGEEAK